MKRQYTSTLQRWILTEALKAGTDGISRDFVYRKYYHDPKTEDKHRVDLTISLRRLKQRGLILAPAKPPKRIILTSIGRNFVLAITEQK